MFQALLQVLKRVLTEVEVSNATSTNNGRGVLAEGGMVYIENDVDTIRTGLRNNAGCGVKALNGARVTVGGDVIGAQAINASGENTMVHVDGKAIGTGDGVAAVYADNKARLRYPTMWNLKAYIS